MIEIYKEQNRSLKEKYDSLAKHYNQRLHEHIPHHKKVLDPFINLLKNNFDSPRVLDLGCGVGLNSLILENEGFDVLGIDYSKECVNFANLNCPKSKFVHDDFLEWNPEDKFHGVIAGSFLDKFHPDLLPELLSKIDSVLYPKGIGLVYMPVTLENEKHHNPYVALLARDAWLQHLSSRFKVVNYYEGYGCRDWFISIFQKN